MWWQGTIQTEVSKYEAATAPSLARLMCGRRLGSASVAGRGGQRWRDSLPPPNLFPKAGVRCCGAALHSLSSSNITLSGAGGGRAAWLDPSSREGREMR